MPKSLRSQLDPLKPEPLRPVSVPNVTPLLGVVLTITTAVSWGLGCVAASWVGSYRLSHSFGAWTPSRYWWSGGDPYLEMVDNGIIWLLGGIIGGRLGQLCAVAVRTCIGRAPRFGRIGWWDLFVVGLPSWPLWHLIWLRNTDAQDPLASWGWVYVSFLVAWLAWRGFRRIRSQRAGEDGIDLRSS